MICQTCGFHSSEEARFCPLCGSGRPEIKPEKVEKKQKKSRPPGHKRVGYIVLLALAVLALAAFVGGLLLSRSVKYSAAVRAFESGSYVEAASAFRSLGNYKDAGEKREEALEAAYQEALRLMKTEDYEGAVKIFSALSDYKDSKDQLLLCNGFQKKHGQYLAALSLLEAGENEAAIHAFDEIKDYKDSDMRRFQAAKVYYLDLLDLYEAGDFESAKEGFTLILDYPGAQLSLQKTNIALACQSGKTEEAKADFFALYQTLSDPSLAEDIPIIFKGSETVFTLEEWKGFLDDYVSFRSPSDSESQALRERRFSGYMKIFGAFRAAVQGGLVKADTAEGTYELFSRCRWQLADGDGSLLSSLGASPGGKVLICSSAEGEALSGASVELSLMALLPEKLLPSSLQEVEYLVRIIEGKDVFGHYDSGAIAYKRRAQVVVYKLPKKEEVKTYETVYGSDPPVTYTYSVWAPSVLGGAPDYNPLLKDILNFIATL